MQYVQEVFISKNNDYDLIKFFIVFTSEHIVF